MAQRTGAERFLASLAKTASARASLALAVAALALAGCGSSSDEETTAASDSGTAATAAKGAGEAQGAGGAQAQGGKDAAAGESSSKTSSAAPAGSSGGGQGAGQKRGQRIAQPTGERESAPTPAQIASATVADMSLRSPAVLASGEGPPALPATYTCDGKGSWPELRWSGVPSGTAELILYAMSVQPVEGQLFVDWAVAGLDPGLEGIEAGKLPKGAITGTNSFGKRGYEICPAGAGEIYMFAVYALPQSLSPPRGFDARALRSQILEVSGNVGLLPVFYSRG